MASAGTGGDKYRSFMDGEGEKNTVWRHGVPPNFDVVNKLFEEERTKVDENLNSTEEEIRSLRERLEKSQKVYDSVKQEMINAENLRRREKEKRSSQKLENSILRHLRRQDGI
ncbi:pathogen-related protein-like [Triticum dicoccoides]|uniref:pathogen-related protein-like n=1 Tax=Triticum dicoccoides TaxID=85692 RepID=UPI0018917B72|nr:pathogen-related protein-like [Triticum dicoccoides]